MDRAKDGFVTDRCASATARALLALLALVLLAFAPSQAQTTHIAPRLVAESVVPSPGGATTIALAMTPDKGWHGYWSNGGDAGFGMQVEWNAPPGVTVGAFRYPVPEALTLFGLMNHVYEHPYALLADVRVDKSVAPGTDLTLTGIANWLACTDKICVPEKAVISVAMKAGDGAIAAGAQQQFDAWRAKLPQPLDRAGRWERRGAMVRFAVPLPEGTSLTVPHLFAATQGVVDYPAVQRFSRNGDWIVIETAGKGNAQGEIDALLKLDQDRGLSVRFVPGAVPAAGKAIAGGGSGGGAGIDLALFWTALGGAIVGGLILNLMPCVFPILSLKALSLARSGDDARAAKVEAVAYTAGAALTALLLGALLLGLRAAGEQVGWAFQLQHPASVFVLLLLALAITLNLLGVFELPSFGGGQRLANQSGAAGGFWTGALAAFVATPCSGPLLGAALGATLVLPAWAALPIFGGLGLGIALPFLAVGFVPALRNRMPKPGPWMATFRKWMALPMALTALALAVLLWRQVDGREAGHGAGIEVSADRYSAAALAKARATGKPVFVYFTADWCLSCKANEAGAINREAVQDAFDKAGVVTLVGDWTNGDPALTRALAEHGRNSVPLYLWYAPGKSEPEILPQILTPGLLTDRTGD